MSTTAKCIDNLPILTQIVAPPSPRSVTPDVLGLELSTADSDPAGYDPYNNPPPPDKDPDITGRRLALANRLR